MIKQFEPSKLDQVMNIWLDTNIEAHPFVPKEFWLNNYEGVKSALFDAEILIYEEELVKGFIGIIGGSYIAGLFVAKQFQGQGIGRKLIEECKARYSSLVLDVFVKNSSAVQFYTNCGFEIIETKENEDTQEEEYSMVWKA
ncbi:putative N-acetyltransferase YjaB [compost metagenome]